MSPSGELDFGPLAPLCQNVTSSTKPEVHNVLHCRQRRTKPRPHVTCKEIFVKFGHVVFELWEPTGTLTDRHTSWSQYFAHLPEGSDNSHNKHGLQRVWRWYSCKYAASHKKDPRHFQPVADARFANGLARLSAVGAMIEAHKAPRGCGEGVFDFGSQNVEFYCILGAILKQASVLLTSKNCRLPWEVRVFRFYLEINPTDDCDYLPISCFSKPSGMILHGVYNIPINLLTYLLTAQAPPSVTFGN